ncbi:MAG: asparagine synthase (glutamine-hydrolyzing) [Cyanobium sp.]
MCGLFGAIGGPALDPEPIRAALANRGPDAWGLHSLPGGFLLHTRLAIQDLSPLGSQPMGSADGRHWLVFNGEIYNAPELRRRLQSEGCHFRSHSDTEVILEGVIRWGDALWPRLEGIFACALWDGERQRLTLARDPFGIKPLLIRRWGEGLLFGSELAAFQAAGAGGAMARADLAGYALWGAFAGPATAVEAIRGFPPGHLAHWQVGQPLRCQPFDSPLLAPLGAQEQPSSFEAAVEGVRQRLSAAVQRQTIGDVPVGAFLSGGLDSGILAALLRQGSPRAVRTLSVGFRGLPGAVDESERALASARHIGSEHTAVVLGPEDFDASVDAFLAAIDQPSIDGFNTFLVSRAAAAAGLKVAFSGLGADEVFAGYGQFAQLQAAIGGGSRRFGRLPVQLLRRWGQEGRAYRRRGLAAALDLRSIPFSGLSAAARRQLLAERLHPGQQPGDDGSPQHPDVAAAFPAPALAALSRLELRGYLRDTLLRDTDAVSMHHALEVRVPYLDGELVRYSLALPGAWHLAEGPKTLLRRAAAHLLPEAVQSGPKRGFNLPLGPWLLQRPRFAPERIAGLLRPHGLPRRSVLAAWAYLRLAPARWQPYWRWVVLAEWLPTPSRDPGLGDHGMVNPGR